MKKIRPRFKISVLQICFVIGILICLLGLHACTKDSSSESCSDVGIQIDSVTIEDSDCILADGAITVHASGGLGNFLYKINASGDQTTSVFSNLPAGSYVVTVAATEHPDCEQNVSVTVKNKGGVNIQASSTSSGCGSSNGTITATAVDGFPPFQYKIGNGAFSEANSFSSLSPGTYSVIVRDSTGCEAAQTVLVQSGISFAVTVNSIIQSNCAITDCHNGKQSPDLRTYVRINQYAATIKRVTAERSMPPNDVITQQEIDAIGCWVNDGAPQN